MQITYEKARVTWEQESLDPAYVLGLSSNENSTDPLGPTPEEVGSVIESVNAWWSGPLEFLCEFKRKSDGVVILFRKTFHNGPRAEFYTSYALDQNKSLSWTGPKLEGTDYSIYAMVGSKEVFFVDAQRLLERVMVQTEQDLYARKIE